MHRELTLFEFAPLVDTGLTTSQLQPFKAYLAEVWANRNRFCAYPTRYEELEGEDQEEQAFKQGFFRFDGNCISPRNYVGFIQFETVRINIYPKVFRTSAQASPADCQRYLDHVLYWLSYCSRVRFPFSVLPYQPQEADSFLEALIYLFAQYTTQFLAHASYYCYEEVTEPTEYLKGGLAATEYFKDNVATGNWHRFHCTHAPFQYDNRFNRIIKHVARQLLQISRHGANQEALRRIYFQLEEVTDTYCTYEDCRKVKLNRLHKEWEPVLAMCQMFLAGQTVGHPHEEQANFCFLLPMEYIFEDFIAGFLSRHFSHKFTIRAQAGDLALTEEGAFGMHHDILLEHKGSQRGRQVILDAKYKLRSCPFKDISKADVLQADLYQMTSYAFRRGCREIILLYPQHTGLLEGTNRVNTFHIGSPWLPQQEIRVIALDVPLLAAEVAQVESKMREFFEQHLS